MVRLTKTFLCTSRKPISKNQCKEKKENLLTARINSYQNRNYRHLNFRISMPESHNGSRMVQSLQGKKKIHEMSRKPQWGRFVLKTCRFCFESKAWPDKLSAAPRECQNNFLGKYIIFECNIDWGKSIASSASLMEWKLWSNLGYFN